MCGRYTFYNTKEIIEELKKSKKPLKDEISETFTPSYNVYPQSDIVSALGLSHFNDLRYVRWGLIPFWADDPAIGNRMINARTESIDEKPAFKRPFKRQRCIIPANGFYEWQKLPGSKKKIPFYFRPKDRETFAFAGLFDYWQSPGAQEVIISATIITTPANDLVQKVHNRMPAILDFHDMEAWLDPLFSDHAYLKSLLTPFPAQKMEGYMVSDYVNNPQHNDPKCIQPLETPS